MTWNHRDKIFAVGVALQPTPGVFVQPGVNDLLAAANPDNGQDAITAADPTQTGAIWDSPRVYLGESGSGSANIPLRGPGGATPPAANAFVPGRILQACGFAEVRRATASTASLAAGSTTTQLVLAGTESGVDDFLLGHPIQTAAIGTGVKNTTLIQDYAGLTKTAFLAETLGSAPASGVQYTLPAATVYLLGLMNVNPPLLSISFWRGRKRYDYRDCVISSWTLDTPVANEANQSFPSLAFSFKGNPLPATTDANPPSVPAPILQVPVPPAKDGKFFLDRVMLGHASARANIGLEAGAASNQNAAAGQDGYDILSGSRTIDLDLNQMDVSDFDFQARYRQQQGIPLLSTWGLGVGNRMGWLINNMFIDPERIGSRNGYVSITTTGHPTDPDKSMALAFWH